MCAILAIDQSVEDKDGQKVITGSTATLELAPQQTEVLALAKEMGSLSLTLRSLADSGPTAAETDRHRRGQSWPGRHPLRRRIHRHEPLRRLARPIEEREDHAVPRH